MTSIEQRMDRLEKQVRTFRLATFILVAGISIFLITSFNNKPTAPDLLQAKAFEVVNSSGDVLLRLNSYEGDGQLTSYSTQGKQLVKLFAATGGGGAINTFDTDGEVNFKVTRTSEGGGYMALFNGARKEVFETGCTDNNSGYLRINDKAGEKLLWMTYTQNGGAYLSLMNRFNKQALTFSTPDVGGRMGVYNSDNVRVCYLGTQDTKEGNITVYNSSGTKSGSVPNY